MSASRNETPTPRSDLPRKACWSQLGEVLTPSSRISLGRLGALSLPRPGQRKIWSAGRSACTRGNVDVRSARSLGGVRCDSESEYAIIVGWFSVEASELHSTVKPVSQRIMTGSGEAMVTTDSRLAIAETICSSKWRRAAGNRRGTQVLPVCEHIRSTDGRTCYPLAIILQKPLPHRLSGPATVDERQNRSPRLVVKQVAVLSLVMLRGVWRFNDLAKGSVAERLGKLAAE
jgi:hypothetical protein